MYQLLKFTYNIQNYWTWKTEFKAGASFHSPLDQLYRFSISEIIVLDDMQLSPYSKNASIETALYIILCTKQ